MVGMTLPLHMKQINSWRSAMMLTRLYLSQLSVNPNTHKATLTSLAKLAEDPSFNNLTFTENLLAIQQMSLSLPILSDADAKPEYADTAVAFLNTIDYSETVKERAVLQATNLATIANAMNWSQKLWPKIERSERIQQLEQVAKATAYLSARTFGIPDLEKDEPIVIERRAEEKQPLALACYDVDTDNVLYRRNSDTTRKMTTAICFLAHEKTHYLNQHTITNNTHAIDFQVKKRSEELYEYFENAWPKKHRHHSYQYGVYYAQPEERIAHHAEEVALEKLNNTTVQDYALLADQLTGAPTRFDLIVHNARIMANGNPENYNELADPLASISVPKRRRHQSRTTANNL